MTNSLDRTGDGGMLAPLLGVDGTAALPAFAFTSDPDTGMYKTGANALGLASAGVLRINIGAAGNTSFAAPTSGITVVVAGVAGQPAISVSDNVNGTGARFNRINIGAAGGGYGAIVENGVATSSTDVFNYSAADFASRLIFTSGQFRFGTAPVGVAGNPITFTERVVIANPGNVTINAPASGISLQVNAVAGGTAYAFSDGTVTGWSADFGATRHNFGTSSAHSSNWYSGNLQRVILAAAGNLTVNAPTSGTAVTINGLSGARALTLYRDTSGGQVILALLQQGIREYQILVDGATADWRLRDDTAAANRIVITNAGNVGLNCTAPAGVMLRTQDPSANDIGLEVQRASSTLITVLPYDRSGSAYRSLRLDAADHNFRISGVDAGTIGTGRNWTIPAPASGTTLTLQNGVARALDATGSVAFTMSGLARTFAVDGSGAYEDIAGNNNWRVYTNSLERIRITGNGDIEGRGIALVAYKTATTTRATATPSNDPHLVIAIPSAGTYAVELFVRLNPDGPGGAGGFLWGLNYSGTYTAISSYISSNGMINAAAQIEGTAQIGNSAAVGTWFRAAILSGDWVVIRGTLTATASGTLGFNWAQNSAAGNLTLTAGAYLKATKLS
jgi:hypothetical protein